MSPLDYFYIWLAGASLWCITMSARGEGVDIDYFISAFAWPVMLLHTIGQIIRRLLS